MIKDEILQTQRKLARLKESYKKLVDDIKKVFYDKEDYWDENSPRKPRNEAAKMQAALCLAQGETPRYSFDLTIQKAKNWISKNNQVQLDYWIVYQEIFEYGGGISPTIIIYKKNIKLLREICKKLWIQEVNNSYTTLGFEEWLEATDVDKIFELMSNGLNKDSKRFHLVTDKNLYLKDIIVIFPHKIGYFNRF